MEWITPKQNLGRLRKERFLFILKCWLLSFIPLIAIWILLICVTSDDIPKKMNQCLQTHNLEYCNNHVK